MHGERLLRPAAGVEPVDITGWEDVPKPGSDLLPTLAHQIPAAQTSPKVQGLRRYSWLRYQLLQAAAREVFKQAPQSLLLLDDLYLAGRFYPHPSSRVLHGIDFLVREEALKTVSNRLAELGWRKPSWGDSSFWTEWRNAEDVRLRLHTSWLNYAAPRADHVFEKAQTWQGFQVLDPGRQLCRCGWQGADHLWLLDIDTLSRHERITIPDEFAPLLTAWSQTSLKILGRTPNFEAPTAARWTPARWALRVSHRGRHFFTQMVEQLAMELVSDKLYGWPWQWSEAICRRWSLSTGWQIPGAAWSRLKGDWR